MRARRPLSVLASLGLVTCSDPSGPPPGPGRAMGTRAVVSEAVTFPVSASVRGAHGGATIDDGVTWIAIPEGTLETGRTISLRVLRTGERLNVSDDFGGLDPVPMAAVPGDTIEVQATSVGGTVTEDYYVVPVLRRPIIIRTDPRKRRNDLPLNARIVVVFSEPMRPGTVDTPTVRLEGPAGAVPGRWSWNTALTTFSFTPDTFLAKSTPHRLVVGGQVLDLAGDSLGGATTIDFTTAATSPIPPAVAHVSAGALQSCYLLADGRIECRGGFARGPGFMTFDSSVAGSSIMVAAGGDQRCVLDVVGTASCWGFWPVDIRVDSVTGGGELAAPRPIRMDTVVRLTTLSVGHRFACGLGADSLAYCWGENGAGQLGRDSVFSTSVVSSTVSGVGRLDFGVRPIASTERFIAVEAGVYHACAVAADGDAWCWGDNASGQLGNDQATCAVQGLQCARPMRVLGGRSFTQVAAGRMHTCGIATDGTTWCWGARIRGQLGDGRADSTVSALPVQVLIPQPLVTLTAYERHTCGVDAFGGAWCWGENGSRQIVNTAATVLPTPTFVASDVRQVAAGGGHTCLLLNAGNTSCRGDGSVGQLEPPSSAPASPPVMRTRRQR